MPDDDLLKQFEIEVRRVNSRRGMHSVQTCWLKPPGKNIRTIIGAALLFFGSDENGRPTHWALNVRTWRKPKGGTFQLDESFSARDDEVDRLRKFLADDLAPGRWTFHQADEAVGPILDAITAGQVPAGLMSELAKRMAEQVEFVSDLDDLQGAQLLGMAAELRSKQLVVQELDDLVRNPATKEPALQKLLEKNWWLLGATYVGMCDRRSLTMLDQFDLPLLRADEVLHIVELKRASYPRDRVVVPHRNHFRVTDAVNEAVCQVENYLAETDAMYDYIRSRFHVECKRAEATVIIGHPEVNRHADVTPEQYRMAIRTYNSHLSRVEVLTYEDVVTTARNAVQALQGQVADDASTVEIDRPISEDPSWAFDPEEEPF